GVRGVQPPNGEAETGDVPMKQAIIALVLIGIGSWLAHLHVVSQLYYPVVQLSSPEGLTYTAVQDSTQERQACGAANERFLGPVKDRCKRCQVVLARCERRLEGLELALYDGAPLPHHRVFAPGLRMAIVGPPESAKTTCAAPAGLAGGVVLCATARLDAASNTKPSFNLRPMNPSSLLYSLTALARNHSPDLAYSAALLMAIPR